MSMCIHTTGDNLTGKRWIPLWLGAAALSALHGIHFMHCARILCGFVLLCSKWPAVMATQASTPLTFQSTFI